MEGTAFIACSQARPKIALSGPKSSTTENSTCWVTGLALTEKVTSSIDNVVAPLKLDKILPGEWSWSIETLICLKAGKWSRSAALPGSTRTLCTSKPLMHTVNISAT